MSFLEKYTKKVQEKQPCCFSSYEFIFFGIHNINAGGTMKNSIFLCFASLVILTIVAAPSVVAQSIDQRLQSFSINYAKGYVQPLVDAFGANLNSGLYQSADTEDDLDIYVGIKIIGTFITSDMQTFNTASPYDPGQTSRTATVLGGSGSVIPGTSPPNAPKNYLNGASVFPLSKLFHCLFRRPPLVISKEPS